MSDINILIFDIDGTLVDGRKDIVRAVNFTLSTLGLKQKTFESIVSYIGTGVIDLIKKSLGEENLALTDKGLDIFRKYYLQHCADESVLYPHVKEALDYFKDKKMIILTNRHIKSAKILLNHLKIKNYFEQIIGADDEKCKKPSPCPINNISSQFNIRKEKIIIIGDMDIDILTGKNAGIKTCWVTYGLGKKEDVQKLRPNYIINNLLELKDVIN